MNENNFRNDQQADFHARLSAKNIGALWVARRGVDITKPAMEAVPVHWVYEDLRPDIEEAGAIVSAEEAFRRVLALENPAWPGEMRVTNTLYAGIQLVQPGETAPCHRHSQTALRFVLEGTGAHTTVDGERALLIPGDFVITPYWSWHDHINGGTEDVTWLDILDTPMVGFFDAVFRDFHNDFAQPITKPDGYSPARYGVNMAPEPGRHEPGGASPVFRYAFEDAQRALEQLAEGDDPHPVFGHKLHYIDPTDGGPATPTMDAAMRLLPKGFKGYDYRSTDGMVYCAIEGSGRAIIEDSVFEFAPRDVFVIPGWRRHRIESAAGAILFSVSDRAAQEKLGLWREETPA
ncbi:MAG: cupin domain-containing protein [Pseudomonadota bacterium]|nr:cupin domain-containing protein [Pseudomonadota bacterium]